MDELDAAKLAILEREILVKERDLAHRISESKASAWRSPLVVAVMAAALGGFSNAGITYYNAKVAREAAGTQFDRTDALTNTEAENARILEMIKIGDPYQVQRNLQFLIETKLVTEPATVSSIESYYAGRAPGTGPGASSPAIDGAISRTKLFRPGEILTYGFLTKPSEELRSTVEDSMEEWQKYANIRFEFREEPGDAIIRIGLDNSRGSWAYVGRDALTVPPGAPTLNLASMDKRVVLSELGHALGLPNEHQNPNGGPAWNEQTVIDHFTKTFGWSLSHIRANFFAKSSFYPCSRLFDPKSIMMPDLPDEFFEDSLLQAGTSSLSDSDKLCAAEMYPSHTTVAEQ